ncbi:MAG: hypothetical protein EP341_09065 [Sphingomonadales bacterium]|nr:MAG: hypothetical protein EP341_09065 [Sphingomonadales bacterium]
MNGRVANAVWVVALSAIAIVAANVQLDRQSRRDAELATTVPEPFRAFSQYRLTQSALQQDDPNRSLFEAKRLIERRSVPAEHLSLLASAQFRAGERDRALITIQLAARRGWRDQSAQLAMAQLALAANDHGEAARRLAAVWALAERPDDVRELAHAVIADPAGQAELARLVAASPRWLPKILREGPAVLGEDNFNALIAEARSTGANIDPKPKI